VVRSRRDSVSDEPMDEATGRRPEAPGLRRPGQQSDGSFAASASKRLPGTLEVGRLRVSAVHERLAGPDAVGPAQVALRESLATVAGPAAAGRLPSGDLPGGRASRPGGTP